MCVSVHPRRFAATGGMGGNIRVWDSASGGVLGELFGHKRRISSLAFSLGEWVFTVECPWGLCVPFFLWC